MVRQAICSCSFKTQPFFTNGNINSEVYVKECLKKRLVSMIRKHDNPPVFWPDLASCHYSRSVIEWYQQNGVNFVPKNMNPTNVPQLHLIEKFWANMKRQLRKKGKIAADINRFRRIWGVASQYFLNLVRDIRTKLRKYCDQLEDVF